MSLGKRARRTLYDPYLSVFLARSDGEVYEMGEGLPLLPLFPGTEALPHYSLCKIAKNDNFLLIAKLYHFSNIRYFFEPVLAKKKFIWFKGICNYKTPLSHFRENVILATFCLCLHLIKPLSRSS